MKHKKWKETFSIILSVLFSFALFPDTVSRFTLDLILCVILCAAAYIAFSLILKPVDKIGKNRNRLAKQRRIPQRKTYGGREGLHPHVPAASRIREAPLRDACAELLDLAKSILKYLTDNPGKNSGCPPLYRLLSGNGRKCS